MKRSICLLAILFLIGGFTSNALAAKKPIKLKGVQFLNIGNPSEKGYHLFVDLVNKGAKGELVIDIVGGPESIPGRKQAEAVRSGAVDFCFVPCGWYAANVPAAAVQGLSRIDILEGRKNGFHDFLVEQHKKAGIRFIGANDQSGAFNMFSAKPINSPKELKGMRFRHSPTYSFFKGIGIIGITARHSDLYSGLERGLFTGLCTKLGTFLKLSLPEVCKYIVGPGFWPNYSTGTLMNEAKYQSLPKHLQNLIQDAELKTEQQLGGIMAPTIAGWNKDADKKGMKRIAWSPEETKAYLDRIDKLSWDHRVKKLPPGMGDKMKGMMGL
ncbi:TRAP transporter substrate-binding protein DctP [Thermodesulfobacteriota bacterium]